MSVVFCQSCALPTHLHISFLKQLASARWFTVTPNPSYTLWKVRICKVYETLQPCECQEKEEEARGCVGHEWDIGGVHR